MRAGGGTSRPGGGRGYSSDSDDDLDVTWEDDSFGAAGDVDAAAGAKPAMAESRGGSFGGGEQNAPSSSSSRSRSSSSSIRNNSSYSSGPSRKPSSKSSSKSSSSHDGIPAVDLAATLPKGEARRLYSWKPSATLPSRTRGGNQSRAEERASGSSLALLVQMVR